MFALVIALAQPAPLLPVPAAEPGPHRIEHVDLIVVNQYVSVSIDDWGKLRSSEAWYVSFWTLIPAAPGLGLSAPHLWVHRGWARLCEDGPHRATGGWAIAIRDVTVFAPMLLFLATDYDFEYCNRWLVGRSVVSGH